MFEKLPAGRHHAALLPPGAPDAAIVADSRALTLLVEGYEVLSARLGELTEPPVDEAFWLLVEAQRMAFGDCYFAAKALRTRTARTPEGARVQAEALAWVDGLQADRPS